MTPLNGGQISWAARQAQGMYPTPPEPGDGFERSAFPMLLGLAPPPTPMSYQERRTSPSHITGEVMTHTINSGEGAGTQILTVSTSFHPGSHTLESDLILRSSDAIHFFVHTDYINKASQSALPAFLSYSVPAVKDGIVSIPETGRVLNIILHAAYGTSVARNSPSCADLIEAVNKMPLYGLAPRNLIRPDTPLYTLLLTHAPLNPIAIYTIAAHHDIFELAKQTSSHLLAFPLNEIDDNTAALMGHVYLKRLFLLHMNRTDAARKVFLQPPAIHPITKKCNFEDQKKVKRAWALGSTYLAWELRADLSTHRIKSVFEPLVSELDCADCQEMLSKRIREVLVAWAAVKCTI